MLLLMPILSRETDQLTLRDYQSRHWGMRKGETCVIELGGLSAKHFRISIDRTSFRQERIRSIAERLEERMEQSDHPLKLVVMYGSGSKDAWKKISGYDFSSGSFMKRGQTTFAFMSSPTAFGQRDEEWTDLGARIAAQL